MGLLLDLAVVVLAVAVTVSLGLLAWTLAVSAVAAVGRGRGRTAEARRSVSAASHRLQEASVDARTAMDRVATRAAASSASGATQPGDTREA